jgi:hypothetical protein
MISTIYKKKWKDMTFDERVACRNRRNEIESDLETKIVKNILSSHEKALKKKKEAMNKLRSYLLVKRGLIA